jgi:hypothetical protein
MYQLATCVASILRPTGGTNARGDKVAVYTELVTGLPASIVESNRTTYDRATQTPRTVRTISGLVSSGTDVLIGDRIRDDTNGGILYVVKTATQPRSFGYLPDIELDLARVGTGD